MLKPSNKTLHLTSARASLSRFNVSSAAAAGELCRSQARVGLIDRVVSDRSALAVPAVEGNDDLAGPAILRAASLERGTAQPVAVLENGIHRFPSRS